MYINFVDQDQCTTATPDHHELGKGKNELFQKTVESGTDMKLHGKMFQRWLPVTGNAWLLIVESCAHRSSIKQINWNKTDGKKHHYNNNQLPLNLQP